MKAPTEIATVAPVVGDVADIERRISGEEEVFEEGSARLSVLQIVAAMSGFSHGGGGD